VARINTFMESIMTRLYTYIIPVDSGLAPNPFWDWCTLAVCTPNHQGSAVKPGEWIAGFSTKETGYQFIYAMKVDERIHMNDYFNDPRFQSKKPDIAGNWKQRCGDNFYSQLSSGEWVEHPNPFHESMRDIDTKIPYVFVGHKFWYLGRKRVDTPHEFLPMIGGRGARVNHPQELVDKFKAWVQMSFKPGITAIPLDAEYGSGCINKDALGKKSCD
jgi:hypothetical protein